ncbi:MAG TPA: hypothetical protein VGQ65_15775 [Thermoanaerobaculia bacterium]|jgi:hypothetical protein|nr:hypothetical protein [Thermoanaerobaculia bacterium]
MLATSLLLLSAALAARAPDPLILRAVNPNPAIAGPAIAALRKGGQPSVDAMLAAHASFARDAQSEERFRTALDRVCRQADCLWSGLYWFTDLAEAKRISAATHRPILSLRLLGDLGMEMSCANSRYFRTVLYPNREIAAYLRDNFVLHWSSERPVPTVTIDFGDGRVLHRTITGNSIHYLLDATGRPLDALPGLYAPKAFLAQLREMVWLHDRWTHSPAFDRDRRLLMYHALRARSASETAERYDGPETAAAARRARLQHPAYAWEATRLTFSKEGGEEPMFKSISFGANSIVRKAQTVAERFDPDEQFSAIDESALNLIRDKRAPLHESPAALARVIESFRQTLALDTLQNEYVLRPEIHRFFVDRPEIALPELNGRVYSEVFKTPSDDPWLGLRSDETFTALAGEGVEQRRDTLRGR